MSERAAERPSTTPRTHNGTHTVAAAQAPSLSLREEFARETVQHGRGLAWLALQLVVLGVLARSFAVESPVFFNTVLPLAIAGSIAHHLLPKARRLTFFVLLSIASIWLVFGLADGSWLVGIGLVLIAICHLPIPRSIRIGLLLGVGGLLAAQRLGTLSAPWSVAIWPIFGSMFMFRLIVYVYDIQHAKQRTRWEERLAYFFCLPNVAFPLFPVIDFATFRRTYYDRPALEIYREGVRWIVRGLTHLVLYRIVYQYGTVSPADVDSGAKLVQHAMATYGLYLRVSGQFHLIVGMLHLFGFRLPETHKFFFLASSFSDLWKRINIYWKDFMQKLVYMPAFFRLVRARGETVALVVSSVLVFVVTWALHSYQWFWVLGTWLWSTTDALFWAILGVGLIVNQLLEKRRTRARSVGVPDVSLGRLTAHGVQTAAMFALMCGAWALWGAPTLGDFVAMVGRAVFAWRDVAVVLGVLSAVAMIAAVTYRRSHHAAVRAPAGLLDKETFAGFAFLGAMAFAGSASAGSFLPESPRAVLANIKEGQLNKADLDQLQRGYYEQMTRVNKFNGELWRLYGGQAEQPRVGYEEAGIIAKVDDERFEVVRPNIALDFLGKRLSTNAWGMRDQPYAHDKPTGTWRVALFGQSYVFGSGVADGETFESLVESRLNVEAAAIGSPPRNYEILNFSVPAAAPFQHLATIRSGVVAGLSPDVVMLVGHRQDLRKVSDYLQDLQRKSIPVSLPGVARLLESSGITATTPRDSAQIKIAPVRDSMLTLLFTTLVSEIRAIGAIPAYALIPTPLERQDGDVRPLVEIAARAGFVTIDLSDVYRGRAEHDLILSESDRHPNAAGHRVIADRLSIELQQRPELLGLAARTRAGTRAGALPSR